MDERLIIAFRGLIIGQEFIFKFCVLDRDTHIYVGPPLSVEIPILVH